MIHISDRTGSAREPLQEDPWELTTRLRKTHENWPKTAIKDFPIGQELLDRKILELVRQESYRVGSA